MSKNPENGAEASVPGDKVAQSWRRLLDARRRARMGNVVVPLGAMPGELLGRVLAVPFRVEQQLQSIQGKCFNRITSIPKWYEKLHLEIVPKFTGELHFFDIWGFINREVDFREAMKLLPPPVQKDLDLRKAPMRQIWEKRSVPPWWDKERVAAAGFPREPIAVPDFDDLVGLILRIYVRYEAVQLVSKRIPPDMRDYESKPVKESLLASEPEWLSTLHAAKLPGEVLHRFGPVPIPPRHIAEVLAALVKDGKLEIPKLEYRPKGAHETKFDPFYWLRTPKGGSSSRPTSVGRKPLRVRAEKYVRDRGYPGLRALARFLDCPKVTLSAAIKDSTFLTARKAEYEDTRAGKSKAHQLTDFNLDATPQSTEPDPSESLDQLVAEQAADACADRRRKRVR